MSKKGENIYRRKDGRWEGRIWISTGSPKKRKYRSVYGKTYREVKEKVVLLRKQVDSPADSPCTMSMEEASCAWLAGKRKEWKESTYGVYRQITEKYIIPYLGKIPLNKINGQVMNTFASNIMKKNEKEKLANSYLLYICSIVLRILFYIKKETNARLIMPNLPPLKGKKTKIMPPEVAKLAKLEEYLLKNIEDETCLCILVALHTGVRIGDDHVIIRLKLDKPSKYAGLS